MPAEISQTLDRGLRALQVVADAPEGLTVTELATILGVNRTIAHRLVATLELHGLVRRDARARLRLGLGLLPLVAAVQPLLRDRAVPVLRSLADRVGSTAHLTVAEAEEGVAVVVIEPSRSDFHVSYRVGRRHPLTKGAAGRAILAGREGDVAAVETMGELQPGAYGVAAPLPGIAGLEASVGVISLGPLDLREVGPRVVAAAADLAAALA